MTGIASLAKALGHHVTGSDKNFYPPMSHELERLGIEVDRDYEMSQLERKPDYLIVGNVMTRGYPVIEAMLDKNIPFISGPQWLAENILKDRTVIVITGTHGKTTTSSILTWILEDNDYSPGYLIGGVPENFNHSASLGNSEYFIIEADEYDTAFFDKRPKFLHYRPNITVINNLEFDHADIYKDLDEIKWQFHQLLRITPSSGKIIANGNDENIQDVIEMGAWSPIETFGFSGVNTWTGGSEKSGNIQITYKDKQPVSEVWDLEGNYNIENALGAIAAANAIGVNYQRSIRSLTTFSGVKRRLEKLGTISGVTIYDDFAHHPTSISKILNTIKNKKSFERIIAVVEIRSNTMLMGLHDESLLKSLKNIDQVYFFQSSKKPISLESNQEFNHNKMSVLSDSQKLVENIIREIKSGDVLIFLSNGDFQGARELLLEKLKILIN